jgi:hypothetical protein
MNLPMEVYKAMLFQESVDIAGMHRTDDFDALAIIASESPDARIGLPVSLTNVHMVPGETKPYLRKVEERNHALPSNIAEMAIEHCVSYMSTSMPHLHHDIMRSMAQAVAETCEEIDAQEERSITTPPFRTIGLLAVYITDDGEPFVTEFGSHTFFEALGENSPETREELPEPDEIPDEVYKLYYDIEAEHKDLPPFEQWKQEGIRLLKSEDGSHLDFSIGYLGYLLLPKEVTHPTVNKILFE